MNKRTFVKNTAVMTVTSLLLRTLGIVFRVFISGRVGAEGMGLYQLVFSVYVLGTTFAAAGIVTAVTRMVAEQFARGTPSNVSRVMRLSMGLCALIGVLSAAVLYVGAPTIGDWIGDERTVPALAVSGLALPFIGVASCIKGYFMARRRTMPPCVSQIVEQAVRIGSILCMLHAAGECSLAEACRIIIVGDAISETVACVFLYIAHRLDRRSVAVKSKAHLPYRTLLRTLLNIAAPLTAGRYLSTALRTVENILVPARLTLFTHADAVSLEQFGAVKGMALPLIFFPSAFLMTVSGLLVPELSDAYALGMKRQVKRLTEQAMHITWIGSVLIGCLFTVLGRRLGLLLYGDDTVGLFLQILGPLTPVMYLDSVASGMLKGINEQVHSLWYSVADSAVRITLIWLLLPRFGITGFLFVMLVSNLLTCILSTRRLLTQSDTKMQWLRWVVGPTLIAALVGGSWAALGHVLSLRTDWLTVIGGMAFISLAYILLLPLFRCFTLNDLKAFTRKKTT
ncbi:MAG: polysaccharide biosynthesis protein [Clostridia bacterium]|nr:polysaccharide biosynthesis protein [Clostridia bacterium]